jgi:NAD+ synthase (glutamine-hydrolysing)
MKIAAAQINPHVGNVQANLKKILEQIGKAKELGADVVLFPEMSLTGYPPRDLLERKHLIDENINALNDLAPQIQDIVVILGYVEQNLTDEGKPLYNAAAVIEKGDIAYVTYKSLLPTYDVFDEDRYFEPAAGIAPIKINGQKMALTICEDIWADELCGPRQIYHKDPIEELAKKKVQMILNISASPWSIGKDAVRKELIQAQAKKYEVPVVFCNQVGGNDELVFDGNSFAVDAKGEIISHAKSFEEDLILIDLDYNTGDLRAQNLSDLEATYRALITGTRDYAHKCGFTKAVVGLSGGIDSALVACIAAEALGAGNVLGITMPSGHSSEGSQSDSEHLARNLGIEFKNVPIQGLFDSYLSTFGTIFGETAQDVTEENIQARIRGNILMATSNKLGHLVLSTGNKSELATGYCTLYGDMAGGLSVISDLPKTMVYQIAREVVNGDGEVIPKSTVNKAPSAELRPNQKDSDSLPAYDVLDPILKLYIEEQKSAEEIIEAGHPKERVEQVVALVERAEYKRRQMPPGLRVTEKAFGIGRRIPIASKR